MLPPQVRYVSPKEAAERKARRRTLLFRIAIALPLIAALLVFGYSDQAPQFLREAVIALDRAFGYPILWLLATLTGR